MTGAAPTPHRPTVGLLVDNLVDPYEVEVWRGAALAAAEADANLLCFVGGTLAPWHSRNQAFELAAPENVDALVMLAGSIGYLVDEAARRAFVARYAPLPVITVGEELGGRAALLVDGAPAVEQLVAHLVEAHGRRRFAFVGGPRTNAEAQVRLGAYRAALARAGLPADPALVCDGAFDRQSGRRAVEELIDARRVAFDAVVAANDAMAMGAIDELRRRGVDLPGAVAVVGFDDVVDATAGSPPLSTARQPLARLGARAVELALACARGEAPGARHVFPAEPVLRRSCGCLPSAAAIAPPPVAPLDAAGLAAALEARHPALGARYGVSGWSAALGAAAAAVADGGETQPFLLAVERLVGEALAHHPEGTPWFEAVGTALALGAAGRPGAALAPVGAAALTLVGALAAGAQSSVRLRVAAEAQVLRRVILPDLLGEREFHDVLRAELPHLGVHSFFLARFTGAGTARLECHFDHGGVAELRDPAAEYPARQLLPGRFAPGRRHMHAVLPVFARAERLGFALCDMGPADPAAYETLTNQISTMVKLTALLEEVRLHERQLLDTAHHAGMAEVAAGVLHGAGNVLNSVRVSAGEIEALAGGRHLEGLARANALLAAHRDDLVGFFARDPRAALLPDYYARIAEALAAERQRLATEARRLREAVDLVGDSVRALQAQAQDPARDRVAEALQLDAVVDWALRLVEADLSTGHVRLRRERAELPALRLPRARLAHAVVAVLRNAIEAMRDAPAGARELTVRTARGEGGEVRLEIGDTGRGIAAADLERIFTFGFASRLGARGFGLHTAANALAQLGGALTARSDGPGRGATFTFSLPPE